MNQRYKIEIFAPPEALPALQDALAVAGAGRIGNYDRCLSITRVMGTWRPLQGAEPYSGEIGRQQQAEELKLEVNCPVEILQAVVRSIRNAHPYEEPVINIIPLYSLKEEEERKE